MNMCFDDHDDILTLIVSEFIKIDMKLKKLQIFLDIP